jgi:aspartyl/asparaginyl beta-hydroxylase (cupin superfamily)
MPRASAKIKRLVVRAGARPRRAVVWAQLRRRAAAQGFGSRDLERFYHYLSHHLKLEKPDYVDPLQQPPNYFPDLRSQPIYSPSEFAWTREIFDNFNIIKNELLEFSETSNLEAQPQGLTDRGRWNVLYFYAGGRRVDATTTACPLTAGIIDLMPGAGRAGQAYLSVLRGDTHITRHFGPTNTRLRCHVGLVVPDGARIRIGEETYRWEEGKCLIFDDSFDHEVWNEASSERVVLIVDFWHPDVTPAETWAITEARGLRFGLRDILHA